MAVVVEGLGRCGGCVGVVVGWVWWVGGCGGWVGVVVGWLWWLGWMGGLGSESGGMEKRKQTSQNEKHRTTKRKDAIRSNLGSSVLGRSLGYRPQACQNHVGQNIAPGILVATDCANRAW